MGVVLVREGVMAGGVEKANSSAKEDSEEEEGDSLVLKAKAIGLHFWKRKLFSRSQKTAEHKASLTIVPGVGNKDLIAATVGAPVHRPAFPVQEFIQWPCGAAEGISLFLQSLQVI